MNVLVSVVVDEYNNVALLDRQERHVPDLKLVSRLGIWAHYFTKPESNGQEEEVAGVPETIARTGLRARELPQSHFQVVVRQVRGGACTTSAPPRLLCVLFPPDLRCAQAKG